MAYSYIVIELDLVIACYVFM